MVALTGMSYASSIDPTHAQARLVALAGDLEQIIAQVRWARECATAWNAPSHDHLSARLESYAHVLEAEAARIRALARESLGSSHG